MTADKANEKKRQISVRKNSTTITNDENEQLAAVRSVLASAATGDFTKNVPLIAEQSGGETTMLAGVLAMQELLHKQAEEIASLRAVVQSKTNDHSRALEEAQALTHLGSWEWNVATDEISWSDELYRIYGLQPQERQIGFEEFIELIHSDDRTQVQEIISTAFSTGESFEFEHRIVLPTGVERILKGMGKIITDKVGKPVRMLGTSQDITLAKQLDRAKDEFLSLVSHQLRTPLTIIRIHGNILEDGIAGPLEAKQESHIRTMTSASIRLISLVDDILSVSRLTLNRIRINAQPVDTTKLIEACIEEMNSFIQLKDTKITFIPDHSLESVPVDTVVFGEILRNLLSNAVRYAKQPKGEIEIEFRKDKSGYVLKVKDNGIGIPLADQASIFDRFYRAQNAKIADSEGSGLGLYVVKLFTETAGGKIWFESEEGNGTTFYVAFPFQGMQSKQLRG